MMAPPYWKRRLASITAIARKIRTTLENEVPQEDIARSTDGEIATARPNEVHA